MTRAIIFACALALTGCLFVTKSRCPVGYRWTGNHCTADREHKSEKHRDHDDGDEDRDSDEGGHDHGHGHGHDH